MTAHISRLGSGDRPRPLVSVILCGFNQVETIGRAVESVLEQTYSEVELVAIDNGSKDGTAEALGSYASDPRVSLLLYPANRAVTERLNAGIAASSGKYISLLYGDDYYLPSKLETQVSCIETLDERYGVVYSPGYRLNVMTGQRWTPDTPQESGDILGALLRNLGTGNFINPISPLVRRGCFVEHPFYEDMFVEGEAHYLRIATTHWFRYQTEPVVVMTEHLTNIGKAFRRSSDDFVVLLERLRQEPGFPLQCERELNRCLAMHHKNVGWQELRVTQDPRRVRRCMERSVRTSPWALFHPKVLAGWTLSFAPQPLLQAINRLGYRLTRPPGNVAFRDGYS